MRSVAEKAHMLSEVVDQHREWYADSANKEHLQRIIAPSPYSSFSQEEILRILWESQSVFSDTHVKSHQVNTPVRTCDLNRLPNTRNS